MQREATATAPVVAVASRHHSEITPHFASVPA